MTSRASGFAISSEVDEEDESPRFSGHGKRIPPQDMNAYAMGMQVNMIPEQPTSGRGRYTKLGRSASKESMQSAASEETNEQFAETEVIGIVSIDRTGTVLFSNSKAQDIFQFPALTGGSIHDFVPNNYFGTDKFQELHDVLIKAFFDKPFAGGRMLDPGTILRAKLQSGKLVPLNVGLEAKIDPKTGKPRLVIAYITEAGTLIDQSKVEKMLSRATLVILQQFISQAILSSVGFFELIYVPPLRYHDSNDDIVRLAACKHYTFNKLTLDGDQGEQDYKMLLYVISTATTILISVLPLFVNHMNDHNKDEVDIANNKKSCQRKFRDFANQINDAQEYLSTIKIFRSTDIVTITTLVCITNLFLLYELKALPSEYEIEKVKECEQMADDELNLSISMCVLGALPMVYFLFKMTYRWLLHGCPLPSCYSSNNRVVPTYGHKSHAHFSARTKFKSKPSVSNFSPSSSARQSREMSHDMGDIDEEAPKINDYSVEGAIDENIRIGTIT